MSNHQLYMQRAFDLALLGAGFVAPNPMVGCVIVHNDTIIGEGFHEKYGGNHAEVNAINAVTDKSMLSQSTAYVTLEPCSHFGKTPPCADLLVKHKLKKVFVSNLDPNPLVAGKGIEKLQKAGIEIELELCENIGQEINKRFFTFQVKKRPYIILKWAETADGFIAGENGKQIQISNAFSIKLVHKMRAENAAIIVGTNTAKWDNPKLNVRNWDGTNPTRILIDKHLTLNFNFNIFDQSQTTICYNLIENKIVGQNIFVKLQKTENLIPQILSDLFQRNIQSVLVEGGATLINLFFEADLWDEAKVFTSKKLLGNGIKGPRKFSGKLIREQNIEDDLLKVFIN